MGRVATIPVEVMLGLGASEAGRLVEELARASRDAEEARAKALDSLFAAIGEATSKERRHELLAFKREVARARTSLALTLTDLPAAVKESLETLNERLQRLASIGDAIAPALKQELSALRVGLLKLAADDEIREAVLLSSQGLFEALEKYRSEMKDTENAPKHLRQTERSLIEFLARCCFKTNPRSTITAVHLARWSDVAGAPMSARHAPPAGHFARGFTTLALPVAEMLAAKLSAAPEAWKYVRPRVNASLRKGADDSVVIFDAKRGRELTTFQLKKQPLLELILQLAEERRLTAEDLLARLKEAAPTLSENDLAAYYKKLGEAGLLHTTLEIPCDVKDALGFILDWAAALPPAARDHSLLAALSDVRELLAEADLGGAQPGRRMEIYGQVCAKVGSVLGHTFTADKLIVIDAKSPWQNVELGLELRSSFSSLVSLLKHWEGDTHRARELELELFSAVTAAFPGRAEVPVAELTEDAVRVKTAGARELPASPVMREKIARLAALIAAKGAGKREIELTREEFEAVCAYDRGRDPGGNIEGSVYFHVDSSSGRRRLVPHSYSGVISGCVARWSYLFADENGSPHERALAEHESAKSKDEALWASVRYQSANRIDSANWHPPYHSYEIELSKARSSLNPEKLISTGDLYLRVDHETKTLMTISRTCGREVVPAYDGLVVIRNQPGVPLWQLARQKHYRGLHFEATSIFADELPQALKHCPRVVVEDVVLLRETWIAPASSLGLLESAAGLEAFVALNRWRAAQGIPRFFFATAIVDPSRFESHMAVDAWNPVLADAFLAQLKAWGPASEVWVREMLPSPDGLWTRNERGHYAHELVAGYHFSR